MKLIERPRQKKRRRTGEEVEADGAAEGHGDSRGPRPRDDDEDDEDGGVERDGMDGSEVEGGRPMLAANPEEINIDDALDADNDEEVQAEQDDDEEEEEEENEKKRVNAAGLEDGLDDDDMAGLVEKPIPTSLFGQATQ